MLWVVGARWLIEHVSVIYSTKVKITENCSPYSSKSDCLMPFLHAKDDVCKMPYPYSLLAGRHLVKQVKICVGVIVDQPRNDWK